MENFDAENFNAENFNVEDFQIGEKKMHPFCDDFIQQIQDENKEKAFFYIMDKLKKGEVGVVELYSQILAPTLNQIIYRYEEQALRIWEEHVYTGIILTIMENCYPYVLKERDKDYKKKVNKSVMIICPSKEYHILGARMATDFFTIANFNATFVGNDTPQDVIVASIKKKDPDYIAISVTNPYHLVATKRTLERIHEEVDEPPKVILGGNAVHMNKVNKKNIKYDMILKTFDDIIELRKKILEGSEN